jgi:FkbM family methyltransferase
MRIIEDIGQLEKLYSNEVQEKTRSNAKILETIIEAIYSECLAPSEDCIDGGAHMGRHCLPMAENLASGQVYAFEAIPALAEKLQSQIEKKGLEKKIVLVSKAISNREGTTSFMYAPDSPGYSGIKKRKYPPNTKIETINVPLTTLDSEIKNKSNIKIIKLDLEGGEFHALQGAEQILHDGRPVVMFENGRESSAGFYNYTKNDFWNFFKKTDYELYDIFGTSFFPEFWNTWVPWTFIGIPSESRKKDQIWNAISKTAGTIFPELWQR